MGVGEARHFHFDEVGCHYILVYLSTCSQEMDEDLEGGMRSEYKSCVLDNFDIGYRNCGDE